MSWIDQGRQYHQWFGHGTSNQDMIDGPTPSTAPADPADRAAFVAISAGHALPNPLRSQYAQVLQQNGLKNLKESLPVWADASGLPHEQFRKLLIGPTFGAQSAAELQALSLAFQEATTLADLTHASDLLAKVVEREGPNDLGYKLAWARDETKYAATQGLITAAAAPVLRAPGEIVGPLLRGAARTAFPLARAALATGLAIATAPETAAVAVAGAILLLATRGGVTNVAVAGYGDDDHGVVPVSAEVNARGGTILLYHGRTIDPSTREGSHNVLLSVGADGQVQDASGKGVGRLIDGQLVLTAGMNPRELFQGPGSYVFHSMPGPDEERPEVPKEPEHTWISLEKMNSRGISQADVDAALADPKEVASGESGNVVVDGKNGIRVVVDPVENEIVSIHRPGDRW